MNGQFGCQGPAIQQNIEEEGSKIGSRIKNFLKASNQKQYDGSPRIYLSNTAVLFTDAAYTLRKIHFTFSFASRFEALANYNETDS